MNIRSKSIYQSKKRWKRLKNSAVQNEDVSQTISVSESASEIKAAFICNTYLHLAVAIALFITLQIFLIRTGIAEMIIGGFAGLGRGFIFVFLAVVFFFLVLFAIAKELVNSEFIVLQQIGFCLYVFLYSLAFAPMLSMFEINYGIGLILEAGIITSGLFLGLTAVAFLTQKDFSFLLTSLVISSFLLLFFAITGLVFGFSFRNLFAFLLVVLASGWMLYQTSKVLHHYQPNQYIAASIALFSSVTWLFWTILRSYRTNPQQIQNYNNDGDPK